MTWTPGEASRINQLPLVVSYKFSVQFSCSVVSDSLWPHGLQHTRPPCPSPTPRVYSNSCPSSSWCHPTILSSVVPFSSCLQSFPASGSFPVSLFFTSGGQIIGVSASASVLPMNISFRMDWLDLLAVQGTLKSVFQHHSSKASILQCLAFFIVQLSHPYMTTEKSTALTRWTFRKVFNLHTKSIQYMQCKGSLSTWEGLNRGKDTGRGPRQSICIGSNSSIYVRIVYKNCICCLCVNEYENMGSNNDNDCLNKRKKKKFLEGRLWPTTEPAELGHVWIIEQRDFTISWEKRLRQRWCLRVRD